MILICYDGPADATAAVEQAAKLFPDDQAMRAQQMQRSQGR